MLRSRLAASLFVFAILPGCDAEDPAPAAPLDLVAAPQAPQVDYVYPKNTRWLPAYKQNLYAPLKADGYDNIRLANPERYAITEAPANIADVRPMVEWEPMQAIVMQWPSDYLGFAQGASETVAQIAKHSLTVAEVWFVTDVNGEGPIKNHLLNAGISQDEIDTKVKFVPATIDSIWYIDSGPLPIIDKVADTFAFADFRYYHERAYDDGVSSILARALPDLGVAAAVPTYRMPLNTEGGTFQSTTDGICFTGNRQIYNMSCESGGCDNAIRFLPLAEVQTHPMTVEIRKVWKEYVGCVDTVIVNSITDDGTGHIDMFMKVVDDNTIIMGDYRAPFETGTPQETNAARMNANAAFLEAYVKPDGTSFTVPRMVMPGHRSSSEGKVPFTYLNSTFINGLNLWPATGYSDWEASRAVAEGEWEAVMPDWSHIWIDSTELSFWSGAIHCITRTIPAKAPGVWVADGTCADGVCAAPEGGYDGTCRPAELAYDVCWGPSWLCECNDCTSSCESTPSDCPEGLNYTGCCEGGNMVFCDNGAYTVYECQGGGCGWAATEGFYDCAGGQSSAQSGVEDPSGVNPFSCDALMCTPDCTDKACGDDGCGGSCGTCEGNLECTPEFQCVSPCTDACAGDDSGCDGEIAWVCQMGLQGCYERLATDCAASGQICKSAACFDAPKGGEDVTGGGGADAVGGADIGTITAPVSPKKSSGCAAGGEGTPAGPLGLAVLALLALAIVRRRA